MDDDEFMAERLDPRLDMNSTEFNAKDYLASKHATTSYSALLQELQTLKRSTSDKTEQLKLLVASHFDEYLSCHEAIREVAEEIRVHESESELLTTAYQKLKSNTDATLSMMLKRCEEQRKIQHAMAVLNRFRSMFEVPARLRDHLKKKQYLKLVEEYLQLKTNVAKANLNALLKPVFDAAHQTTLQANAELVQQIESTTLSLATHNEAIQALELLGFVAKPALVCVRHQLSAAEKLLSQCIVSPPPDSAAAKTAKIKLKASASTVNAPVVTKTPAEIIQICASIVGTFSRGLWSLVCDTMKSATLTAAEQESVHASVHSILSETIKHFETHSLALGTTPDFVATMHPLFVQFDALRPCPDSVLNSKIQGLKQRFCIQLRLNLLLAFLVAQQQSMEHSWLVYVDNHRQEWTNALQELATQPLLTALTKKPTVLRAAATAWSDMLAAWWKDVQPRIAAAVETNTSATEEAHRSVFCAAIYDGLNVAGQVLVTAFCDGLVPLFADSSPAFGPLAGLTNALHALQTVRPWLAQWFPTKKHVDEVLHPLEAMKDQCFNQYMTPRLGQLDAALQSEETFALTVGDSSGDNDSTAADSHTDDSRHYIFAVLLLLVTWRHEIERCVDEAWRAKYVSTMLRQCVGKIVQFLESRLQAETTAPTWCLVHLQVELAFVCSHLRQWIPLESAHLKRIDGKRGDVQALLSQLELQTQMYRLCLST